MHRSAAFIIMYRSCIYKFCIKYVCKFQKSLENVCHTAGRKICLKYKFCTMWPPCKNLSKIHFCNFFFMFFTHPYFRIEFLFFLSFPKCSLSRVCGAYCQQQLQQRLPLLRCFCAMSFAHCFSRRLTGLRVAFSVYFCEILWISVLLP